MEFLITFIEDNDLGVYLKSIIVGEYPTIFECVEDCKDKYPTLRAVVPVDQELTEEQRWAHTNEGQDFVRKEQLKTGRA